MDTAQEQDALRYAHKEADERWAGQLQSALSQQAKSIGEAIAEGRYELAGSLIRQVDSRTVLICGEPDTRLREPYNFEGFSLTPGSLMPLLPKTNKPGESAKPDATQDALEDDEGDLFSLDLPGDAPWRLKYPVWPGDDEDSERQANIVSRWEIVTKRSEIRSQPILAVNPQLVAYDPFFGLALAPGDRPTPEDLWAHPVKRMWRGLFTSHYTAETYEQHIANMLDLYERHPLLGPRFTPIFPIVEKWLGWPPEALNRLIRAAIVAHDAGKLSLAWQKTIADTQRAQGKKPVAWLVHSDSQGGKWLQGSPPPHALSGAVHSMQVGAALDGEVAAVAPEFDGALPSSVLFTAIATHHSPTLKDALLGEKERLDARGVAELNRLLALHKLPQQATLAGGENFVGVGVQQSDVTSDLGAGEGIALALVIRILRLADGWSQDQARLEVINPKNAATLEATPEATPEDAEG